MILTGTKNTKGIHWYIKMSVKYLLVDSQLLFSLLSSAEEVNDIKNNQWTRGYYTGIETVVYALKMWDEYLEYRAKGDCNDKR